MAASVARLNAAAKVIYVPQCPSLTWQAGDTIPLGRDRSLRVIEVRPVRKFDDDPVLVRQIQAARFAVLPRNELMRREVSNRLALVGRDDATGDVCGIYFFDSADALDAFRGSELARTIPEAYEAVEVRRETFDLLYPLWPERGPFSEINRTTAATPR